MVPRLTRYYEDLANQAEEHGMQELEGESKSHEVTDSRDVAMESPADSGTVKIQRMPKKMPDKDGQYPCDYCGLQFRSYEDTVKHEKKCTMCPTYDAEEDVYFFRNTYRHANKSGWGDMWAGFKSIWRDMTLTEVSDGIRRLLERSDLAGSGAVQDREVPVSATAISTGCVDEKEKENQSSLAQCSICYNKVFPGQAKAQSANGQLSHQACILAEGRALSKVLLTDHIAHGHCPLCSELVLDFQAHTYDVQDQVYIHDKCLWGGAKAFAT